MDRFELANFNLNLLLALDALLGERSVAAAAKLARVTPSAMSHSLAELRGLLGDPLLVRSGRAMLLTRAPRRSVRRCARCCSTRNACWPAARPSSQRRPSVAS